MRNVILLLLLFASVFAWALKGGETGGGTSPTYVWYLDADGDGYYTGPPVTRSISPGTGYKQINGITGPGDCDDSNPTIHPNAPEIANDNIDNNCNGETDETNPKVYVYYYDGDGDGLGDPGAITYEETTTPPDNYVANSMDCNDQDPTNNHILYVKPNAATGGDGSSWDNAYRDLTEALQFRTGCITEIWVAKGTYTTGSIRPAAFRLANNLRILGGFAGNEPADFDIAQRDFVANETILTGDRGIPGDNSDNAYHVVTGNDLDATAIMDGFTITGGNANNEEGVAAFQERGGAVLLTNSAPYFFNCRLIQNQAFAAGGAVYNNNSSPSFYNCSFYSNTAPGGAGLANTGGSSPVITNCTIANNAGIAINNTDASSATTNSIIWGNAAAFGGTSGTASYNIVQGGFTGTGTNNLASDPMLVNAATGDLRLKPGSPAINAGLNTANVTPDDLDGRDRIFNSTIDIGAYEWTVTCPADGILYVNANAATGGDGSSWTNAYKSLQDALANTCPDVSQIWVATGTYYPTTTSDRSISFVMKPGIAIYGGFDGTEQANYNLADRDFATNATVLSGDLLHNDEAGLTGAQLLTAPTRQDNSYHVIYNNSNGLDENAKLDGFTITAGNSSQNNLGGGMLNFGSSPAISHCIFLKNSSESWGGGLYINNQYLPGLAKINHCDFIDNYSNTRGGGGMACLAASTVITNCNFINNGTGSIGAFGGGILLNTSTSTITGCSFTNNVSLSGGGLYNDQGLVTASNCRFVNNTASYRGGGVSSYSYLNSSYTNCVFTKNKGGGIALAGWDNAKSELTNCSIVNNVGNFGSAGIYAAGEGGIFSLIISNSIVWGNRGVIADQVENDPTATTAVANSLVQGGYTGSGNIDANPVLVDTAAGDLHLQACSPAIDAGAATGAPATDLDGNTRPALDGYDMGAYEFTGSLPVALVLNCPPAEKVFACGLPGISTTTGLAYATTATNITAADLVAAGGSITPGGCAVSTITYQDAIDATNSTAGKTVVNRTFTVTDIGSKTYSCTQVITLQDYTIDATASSKPVAVGTTAILSATVSPAEAGVPVTFYLDDVSKGTSLTGSDGVATLDVSGLPVDVYQVKATVGDCVEGNAIFSVYNPDGGFVTGAGWINSPKAALVASPLITGKANFGLNAKYQKGKNIVDGDTEFKFKAGDFNFKSLNNDAGSLVISGGKATYRGTGTVNDAGDYGFMVVAIDGDVNGTDADRFRIKIWNRALGNKLVYDNQFGKSEFVDDATELGGGAIVIQTPKVKKAAITLQPAATNNEADLAIQVSNNPSAQGQPFRLQVTSTDKTTPVAVTVLDVSGRPVQSWKNQLAGAVLEAGSLWTKGMYIVEAVQDNKRVQVKLLKL